VAGIDNKDMECWNYIKGFDYINLYKMWMNERDWEVWKKRLPESHE